MKRSLKELTKQDWDTLFPVELVAHNPERAEAYEKLKTRLAREFKNDRSGYRIAKSEFIEETLKKC